MSVDRAAIILGVALCLGGCASFPQEFESRPGLTPPTGRNEAFTACRAKADAAPILSAAHANWSFETTAHDQLVIACMEAAGYRQIPLLR
ncbi:MAG TPA: hypothetical protein VG501_02145 [Rhizomicrobium sp.]|nr:hypothetical protein [Rhizomicrobium sp.]